MLLNDVAAGTAEDVTDEENVQEQFPVASIQLPVADGF
jgi:hypothetical protein